LNSSQLQRSLDSSLRKLASHIEKDCTDAHKDYYPSKVRDLRDALKILQEAPSLEILNEVKSNLGFKRLFPLVELAEKPLELEDSIYKDLEAVCDSYVNVWRVKEDEAKEKLREYKENVQGYVLEGIFRKGLSETDNEAWRSIRYNKGGRTIYKYIYDITKGWLHEDLFYAWLKEKLDSFEIDLDIELIKSAHDAERVFKYSKKGQNISGEPDFRLELREDSFEETVFLEVQHVTDRTRRKRKGLIQVPGHRVETSRFFEERYILVAPYLTKENEVPKVSVNPAPLNPSSKDGFVQARSFVDPPEGAVELEKALKSILEGK